MLAWLQNEHLKRKTESLTVAAQSQSIRTNLVKAKIDKSQGVCLCRVCRKVDESIRSTREGMMTWEKYYIGSLLEAGDKWYEHEPDSILENGHYKILWDFSIQTDHFIEAWRPDLVVVDRKERSCKLIDFAFPGDSRIEEKEKGKRKISRVGKGVTEDMEC